MSLLISKKIILGGQIDEFLKGGGITPIRMALTSQCQMSHSVFRTNGIVQSMANVPPYRKGYPFVHSQPTLWTNKRLAFDAPDQ